jgi:hypothetical protein
MLELLSLLGHILTVTPANHSFSSTLPVPQLCHFQRKLAIAKCAIQSLAYCEKSRIRWVRA